MVSSHARRVHLSNRNTNNADWRKKRYDLENKCWWMIWNTRGTFASNIVLKQLQNHYSRVIMSAMVSQITDLSRVCSIVYSGRLKKTTKLRVTGLCEGIHRWPVNTRKGSVTRKIFPFDDVIICIFNHRFYLSAWFVTGCTMTNRIGMDISSAKSELCPESTL